MKIFGIGRDSGEDQIEEQDDLEIQNQDDPGDEQQDPPEEKPQSWQPDDAFMDSLADRVASKMKPAEQPKPEVKTEAKEGEPMSETEIAALMWEDPARALAEHGKLIQQRTLESVAPFLGKVNPLVQDHALTTVLDGLDEGAKQEARTYIQASGIDPSIIEATEFKQLGIDLPKLLRANAELEAIKKSGKLGERPLPDIENATHTGNPNIDPASRNQLAGMDALIKSLNTSSKSRIKVNPSEVL